MTVGERTTDEVRLSTGIKEGKKGLCFLTRE